jgi:hypothetical protein
MRRSFRQEVFGHVVDEGAQFRAELGIGVAPIGDCLMTQTLVAGVFLLVTPMAAAGAAVALGPAEKSGTGNLAANEERKASGRKMPSQRHRTSRYRITSLIPILSK